MNPKPMMWRKIYPFNFEVIDLALCEQFLNPMIPKKPVKIRVPTNCQFCKGETEPHHLDVAAMSRYLNDRGRIIGRDRTGVCAKHQRRLAKSIKRARYIGLMPFVAGL